MDLTSKIELKPFYCKKIRHQANLDTHTPVLSKLQRQLGCAQAENEHVHKSLTQPPCSKA